LLGRWARGSRALAAFTGASIVHPFGGEARVDKEIGPRARRRHQGRGVDAKACSQRKHHHFRSPKNAPGRSKQSVERKNRPNNTGARRQWSPAKPSGIARGLFSCCAGISGRQKTPVRKRGRLGCSIHVSINLIGYRPGGRALYDAIMKRRLEDRQGVGRAMTGGLIGGKRRSSALIRAPRQPSHPPRADPKPEEGLWPRHLVLQGEVAARGGQVLIAFLGERTTSPRRHEIDGLRRGGLLRNIITGWASYYGALLFLCPTRGMGQK